MRSLAELEEIAAGLRALDQRRTFNKIAYFHEKASEKQFEFLRLTATKRQIMLRAGNRLGKSECAAAALAIWSTGEYPSWWEGRVFKKPVKIWTAGIKGRDVRNVMQAKLCGPPGVKTLHGTGYIPREAFAAEPSKQRGVPDFYDTIFVKTKIDGRLDESAISTIQQKTYEEGRDGFQGDEIDVVHLDEEKDSTEKGDSLDIHGECVARTLTTSGLVLVTFTPLHGRTRLVDYYEKEDRLRGLVSMGIADAKHLTPEQVEDALAQYEPHERDARLYGLPMLGSGAIISGLLISNALLPAPKDIPIDFRKIWGIDFGEGDHPFAAVLAAIDDDIDTWYVMHTLRMKGMTKAAHVPAIRAIAAGVPVAWPHDMAKRREAGDGNLAQLAAQYRNPGPGLQGLQMLREHATWKDGSMGLQPAVDEIITRLETGRLKIFDTPQNQLLVTELREWHRKDGAIVKIRDDCISALIKCLMMKRFARAIAMGQKVARVQRVDNFCEGVDGSYYKNFGY